MKLKYTVCQHLYQMWARTLWGSPEFIKMSFTSPPPTMLSKSESASSKISSYCSLSSWGTTHFAKACYNTPPTKKKQKKNTSISKFSPNTHTRTIIYIITIQSSIINKAINKIESSFSTQHYGQVQQKTPEKENTLKRCCNVNSTMYVMRTNTKGMGNEAMRRMLINQFR